MASRLYEIDEGKICGRCSVVYKLRKTERVYEAWRLHIPKAELEESSLLVVVLENFPYFVPGRFNVEVEGHSCSIYRIDESGRKGMDEDEILDRLSQRVSRDMNIGIVPVLIAIRYGWDPRAKEYRYVERTARIISNMLRNPSLLRRSSLRLVAVIPRSVLSKGTAKAFLEMLDRDSIEYATYNYVIDERDIVRRLIDAGLDHKDATLLIDLAKALPERIKNAIEQELGGEYGFIADVYAEAIRLGRRLEIKEAK